MIPHKLHCFIIGLGLALASSGCVAVGGSGGSGSSGDVNADLDQWNQMVSEFDGRRSMFLGKHVQDLTPVGNRLFWYDNTNFDFRLASYDDTTQAMISYTFP